MASTNTAKVLVVMPPPIDAGDAPMNINTVNRKALGAARRLKSAETTKPDVRLATEWKNDTSHSRPAVSCSKALPPRTSVR